MRLVSRLICLLYACSAGLSACTGTEVGNGNRPKNPDETPTSERGENVPTGGGSTSSPQTDTSSQILSMAEAVPYLLAPCASPLVEAGVGSFKAMPDYTLAVVDQSPNWRVDVSQQTVVYSGFVKSAASAGSPYALTMVNAQNLPVANTYTCSSVSSQTSQANEGALTQRSMTVTTERGAALVYWWWLQPSSGSGKVTRIQIQVGESSLNLYRDP